MLNRLAFFSNRRDSGVAVARIYGKNQSVPKLYDIEQRHYAENKKSNTT